MLEVATAPVPQVDEGPALLRGSGEVRALMRACDWSATSLGPPDGWPASLRAVVRTMLTSRFAMWMAWGDELTFLCNDAYLPTVGLKRGWVIGSRSDKVWAEIWPDIGPRIRHVLATGEATWDEALLLYLERSGFAEETYHTFSYSPLADDTGATTGMLCVVAEVTERVIGERQLAALRDLGATFAAAPTRADVMRGLEACLSAGARDVPFALVYLIDKSGVPRLAACHDAGLQLVPDRRAADTEASAAWVVARAAQGAPVVVDVADIPGAGLRPDEAPPQDTQAAPRREAQAAPRREAQAAPRREAQAAPRRALIAPITSAEGGEPVGYLVAGLNPHRSFDTAYQGFIELLTAQVAAAIARADEYERARERADALTEIDRAKTAFFSNVSHEFRTPLTLMLGPLEDARAAAGTAAPEQRERLEIAHRNAVRLLRLVNSLLDFSRIEAGRVEANLRPTDLAAFTADLASSFRSATEKAGLRLIVDAPPLREAAYVDREMWEKIVLNLVSNAFKFTFVGEIEVTLREQDGAARLTVRDTGTGIPASQIEKLFDRFHRVEGARGRSFEGSGIGLALVRELVKLHRGDIDVQSEEGRGTSFVVTIPLGAAHLPAGRVAAGGPDTIIGARSGSFVEEALRWLPGDTGDVLLDGAAPESPPPHGGAGVAADGTPAERRRVLLADDNADLRDYIGRLLTDRGYDVDAVTDGEAALDMLRARRPDILVTDVMMPRLDGFGLLRRVRDDPSLRDLPVVMLSARAGEEAKVEGLDAGADDYLTKPFSARELLARVAANIAMARLRREAAEAVRASEAALRELNEQLEQRVQVAIAQREQAEEALRQSQKMEAVGQLTGGIAHDFNNLLAGISGSLQMLEARVAQGRLDAVPRYVDAAQGAARRATALTQRLLAFSRRQTLDPKPTNINRLIADLEELVRRTSGPNVTVEVVGAAGLWPALVDQNQLENAVLNLCINARDAMPDGGRLTIETANKWIDEHAAKDRDLPTGQYISLCVTDTGTGMSKETAERIFEPFFTTKPLGQGTGLGLSMIYGFVRQSNGQVRVYSELGHGTTMCLYFPRHHGEAAPREDEEAAQAAFASGQGETVGETVLVIDDDATVRMLMVDLLQDAGYRVLEAADGQAGLKILQSETRVDLLITDVGLPGGMNGRQVADAGRVARPALKVLFITGYAENAVIGHGHLEPGMQVITKPFAIEAVANRVRSIIDNTTL